MKIRTAVGLLLIAFVFVVSCEKQKESSAVAAKANSAGVAKARAAAARFQRGEFHVFFTGIGFLHADTASLATADYYFDVPSFPAEKKANSVDEEKDKQHSRIPAHEAFLVFDPELLVEDLTGGRVRLADQGIAEGWKYVILNDDDLSFSGTGPNPITAPKTSPTTDCPADFEEASRNRFWIPSLSTVAEVSGSSKPKSVAISARMNIKGGYIDAFVVDCKIHQFRDKSGQGSYQQPISQVVDWSFNTPPSVGDDVITIYRRPANQQGEPARPFLRLRKTHPKYDVAGGVVMGSGPIGALLKKSMGSDPVDQHFEIYYGVIPGNPGRLAIPRQYSNCTTLNQSPVPDFLPKWLGTNHCLITTQVVGGMNCGPGDWP